MEILPDVVVTKIAAYLNPRDLVACSAVCKMWRQKFNINAVWTPHCQLLEKYYNIQEKYKDMILCRPYFESLEPLCVGREHYIRDQCLRFNWRAGLFTVEGFKTRTAEDIAQTVNIVDNEGNYWLFITTHTMVQVWNITNKPLFQSCAFKSLPSTIDSIYVLDTKVVVVACNLVQVFSFEHPKYELIFQSSFFYDHESLNANPSPVFYQLHSSHIVNGKILIGYTAGICKTLLATACMHIWNIETVVKLATTNMLPTPFMPYLLSQQHISKSLIKLEIFKGSSHNVVIVLHDKVDNIAVLIIFSTERLMYLNFVKRLIGTSVLWCGIANHGEGLIILGHMDGGCGGFAVGLTDIPSGKDIVMKNLTKLGVDYASQVVFFKTKIFAKTSEDVVLIEVKDRKLRVTRLFEDANLNNEYLNVASSRFIFSKSNEGPLKLWDIDRECQIRDLPNLTGNVDIQKLTCLKYDTDFPPKIVCPGAGNSFVNILSFW